MKRIHLTIVLSFIAVALITIFFYIPEKKVETVRIGVLPHIIPTLPHWIAIEEGFYEKEGIVIKEYPQRSSSVLVQSMINGDVDYIPGVSTVDVINGFADKNSQLQAVIISHAKITKDHPFTGLIVPKNSSISNLRGIEGKKIAVFPGNTAKAALSVFLTEKGVKASSVSMIPVVPPEHMGVLQSGDVDASFAYEPLRTLFLGKGNFVEIYSGIYTALNEPAAIGVSIISSSLMKDRINTSKKLMAVWNKSIDFIENNNVRAREILQKKLNLDDLTANKSAWVNATKTTDVDFDVINSTVMSYQKMGLINPEFKIKPSHVVRND